MEALRAPWEDPDWADETAAWLDTHLTGATPLRIKHTRTWSLIGNTEAAEGMHWLKQVGMPIGYEPALTAGLARLVPEHLPEVVGADGGRLLTRHVRRRLDREVKGGFGPLWEYVVARYAELQIALVPFAADLQAPDGSPEAIVARFGERAEPVVAALGDTIPLTVVHLSVSDKNVCMRDREPVFIDWAAGAYAHPFCGMAKTMRVLVRPLRRRPRRAGAAPRARRVPRAVDRLRASARASGGARGRVRARRPVPRGGEGARPRLLAQRDPRHVR